MRKAERAELDLKRLTRVGRLIRHVKADLAERLAETRKLFRRPVLAVDLHTHSIYSDGRATVEDNYERVKLSGLDFFFATDHDSIGQKRVVRKWKDASWGQEPGAGPQHMGLLCNPRHFRPKLDSLAADYERARKSAPFAWIPHPAGWYPNTWYSDDMIQSLWTLPDSFAVEVINGANKVFRAYDRFDQKAIQVWDKLLCDGRRVTALGASDSHGPDDIGTTWTGVLGAKPEPDSIIRRLNQGRCFASESSLMDFSCCGKPMGSVMTCQNGSPLDFRFRVADSAGIASVRLVSQGKVVREFPGKGNKVVEGSLTRRMGAGQTYYRLESSATDDLRAFSTPIYLIRKSL